MAASDPAPMRATDAELLSRFARRREEHAFHELVERYAPLVLSVARRNTFCEHDAEDAFQATFLVLAQSAHKVRRKESLSAWLYGVAVRVSARARRSSQRDRRHTLEEDVAQHNDPLDELLARHDGMVADEELSALPKNLRDPLVLRYLAGKNNQETAEELGITVAALEGRLKRGKSRLRARLLRRGVTLAAVVASLKATRVAAESLPPGLVDAAVTLAAQPAPAAPTLAEYPINHIALQELSAMNTLILPKVLVSATIAGAVLLAVGVPMASSDTSDSGKQTLELQTSVEAFAQTLESEPIQPVEFEAPLEVVAEAGPSKEPVTQQRFKDWTLAEPAANTFPPAATLVPSVVDSKPRTEIERKIERSLSEKTVAFDFAETPLEEIVDYMRTETGLPILLDVVSLDAGGVAADEPVTTDLPKDLRLESALRLMLEPLSCEAIIKDEVLLITTKTTADKTLDTRIYPLGPSGASADELANLLRKSVSPDSWSNGASVDSTPSGDLLVRQSFAGHREVADVLKQLTAARQVEKSTGAGVSRSRRGTVTIETTGEAKVTMQRDPKENVESIVPTAGQTDGGSDEAAPAAAWTQEDDARRQALKKVFENQHDELRRRQQVFLGLARDSGADVIAENALLNELDREQIARLQEELLEVRRLLAVSAGGSPVSPYSEELSKEIEQLTETVKHRAEASPDLEDRRDEINRLKAALDNTERQINELELKQIQSEILQVMSEWPDET